MAEDIQFTLDKIQCANDSELSEIIKAVIRRYTVLRPDWEVMFFSLPRNDAGDRCRCIEETIDFLKNRI